jgi:VanZ family protein
MFGGLLYAAMRFVRTWLPVILWAVLIVSASTDSFSPSHSSTWLSWLLGEPVSHVLNVAFRKTGHVVAYAILGALAWRADRRIGVALSIALLVAVLDEARQATMIYRSGTPWDVLLDVFGGWLGVLAAKRIWKAATV